MECLWRKSPLSSTEIQANSNVEWKEKTIFEVIKNLQKKNMIHIESSKQQGKSCNLYTPSVTNVDYMESIIRLNPMYNDHMLPSLFKKFILRVSTEETIKQLQCVVDQAKKDLK